MLRPEMEQSLYVEFEQLFSLQERLRSVADQVRAQLVAAGLKERLEPAVFDEELELRGPEGTNLVIRLDSYRLEVTGLRPEVSLHRLAALILTEAEVFRLTSVEIGFSMWLKADRSNPLHLVAMAFDPIREPAASPGEPMLDRRFTMSWDWGTSTTGYSLQAADTEDKELTLSFKAREGYMTLPELETGFWVTEQSLRFQQAVDRFLTLLGWTR